MDLVATVRKEGSRGGRGEFKWSDVQANQHRENYLGHSLMAPVGRWQKGRDLSWYAKGDDNVDATDGRTPAERAKAERAEEIARVKAAEREALGKVLGYEINPDGPLGGGTGTGANSIAVAPREGDAAEVPVQSERHASPGEEGAKEHRRRSHRHRKSRRHERRRSRSRSGSRSHSRDRHSGSRHQHYHEDKFEEPRQRRERSPRDYEEKGREEGERRRRRKRNRSRSPDGREDRRRSDAHGTYARDHDEHRRDRGGEAERPRDREHDRGVDGGKEREPRAARESGSRRSRPQVHARGEEPARRSDRQRDRSRSPGRESRREQRSSREQVTDGRSREKSYERRAPAVIINQRSWTSERIRPRSRSPSRSRSRSP